MKRGAFKPLPGVDPPQPFLGTIVDLSAPPRDERRIILPGEPASSLDLYQRSAQAELRKVSIRPKETTLALGPRGVIKLWPVAFVGQARVWTKPDGTMDLQGVGQLRRVRAPLSIRIGWYLIGAPIWHVRAWWLALRGKLTIQGAIVTK